MHWLAIIVLGESIAKEYTLEIIFATSACNNIFRTNVSKFKYGVKNLKDFF